MEQEKNDGFMNFIEEKELITYLEQFFDAVKIVDRTHIECTKFKTTILFKCYNTSNEKELILE